MLLGFNLLPALPLDGGRVLRALLWRARGDFSWATRIAAQVARGFGYLLVALGVVLFMAQGVWSGVWLAFIGWFLLQAAAAEGRYGLLREALGNLSVRDVMVRDPATVAADSTLAEFMDVVVHAHRYTTYPVVDGGRVLGLVPFAAVARVPRAEWERKRVRECMLPIEAVPHVREDEPLVDALGELSAEPPNRALVYEDGTVVGLLSISDVGRLVADVGRSRRRSR
jgi:CBS domain-containing protein